MGRYLQLFGKLFRYSIITQMQYRLNFLLMLPVHLAWTMQEVIFTLILYLYTAKILNWTKYEIILLIGTYFIIDSLLTSILLHNIIDLSDKIRTGQLDFFILKPIDSQFLVFTYRIDLGLVFAFSIGVVLIIISFIRLHILLDPFRILVYLLLVINGFITFASIIYIISSFAFRTVKVDYVYNLFITFAEFSRKPFDIYPRILRYFMIYVIPLGFIAYIPAGYLLSKANYLWYLSFIYTPVLFLISRKIWKLSIKTYESASS